MKKISTILPLVLIAMSNYSCNKQQDLQPEEKLAPRSTTASITSQEQAYLNLLNSDPEIVYQWTHKKFTEDLSTVLLLASSFTSEYMIYNKQVIRSDGSSVIDFICANDEAWERFREKSAAYAEAADFFRSYRQPPLQRSQCETDLDNSMAGSITNTTLTETVEYPEPNKRTIRFSWACYTAYLDIWRFVSNDVAKHKKVDGEWVFEAMEHHSVNLQGTNYAAAMTYYDRFNPVTEIIGEKNASVELQFGIRTRMNCDGQVLEKDYLKDGEARKFFPIKD